MNNYFLRLNKNIVIFPNAINPNEPQFKQPIEDSNRIRIGWLGGSSHLHDLKLLDGFVAKNIGLKDKIQYLEGKIKQLISEKIQEKLKDKQEQV
jgi:hypothetical protein